MTASRTVLSCGTMLAAIVAAAGSARSQRLLGHTLGTQPFAGYGTTLSAVGDVDGDGVRDLVVGVPRYDQAPAAGIVESGAAELRSSRTGALRSRNVGLQAFGFFGTSVAGLGDVDGDGIPDWSAGSPLMGTSRAGYARVMSGADGHRIWERQGDPSSEFGTAIAGLNDIDSDGRADVAIGLPHAMGAAHAYPNGYVRCYSGATGAYRQEYRGGNGLRTGHAVVRIGDVTGDGRDELVVGEPEFAFGATRSGRAYVVDPTRGTNAGLVWQAYLPFQGPWHAGSVLAAAGDVNGDGWPDVLVGMSVQRVAVLSGVDGTVLRWHVQTDAGFGESLAGGFDYDGDGHDDYAIGAPGAQNGSGVVFVYSGVNGFPIAQLDGATGSSFGQSLAAVGDLDGDGRGDLAVGAPGFASGGVVLGRVSIHGMPIAPAAELFGYGCAGRGGTPDLTVVGEPRIGAAFDVRCDNLPAQGAGFWITGLSTTSSNGTPLPFDLGAIGAPGCLLLVAPDATLLFAIGGQGHATRTFTVPNLPQLAGFAFATQAVVLDATRPGGMTTSNGARIRLGNG